MARTQRPELPRPALMLVTDGSRRGRGREGTQWLGDIAREAALGGVNVVQLREKHLSCVELIDLGMHVRDAITGRALLFALPCAIRLGGGGAAQANGDFEAAITLAACGVHLAEDGPPIAAVRDRVGEKMLISRAVHSTGAARTAERDGADVVVFGTVFESASKPGMRPAGIDGLRDVCASIQIPVIAIGGITAANARQAIEAGAAGVAVISAISDAEDPRAAAAELRAAIATPVRA